MDLLFVVLFFLFVGACLGGFLVWKLYHMAWPERKLDRQNPGNDESQ
jgi:hypothetical protein